MTLLTPRTLISYSDGCLFSWALIEEENGFADGFTDLASLGAHIAGTDPMKFALWNGHQFETVIGRFSRAVKSGLIVEWRRSTDENYYYPHEYVAKVYFPIDPRMTLTDIEGATIAYPNATNNGWLFAHCDSDYHIDHEYRLLAAVTTAFEAEQARAEKVFRDSIYDCFLVNDRGNQAAVTGFNRMCHHLSQFREDVKAELLKEAQSHHLGYYQQNPHEAHIHAPLERAIRAVIPRWEARVNRLLEWTPISTYVNGVLAKVAKKHAYETRWDKEARIEAEKNAASTETDSEDTL